MRFSEEPHSDFSYKTMKERAFSATNATVNKARRMAQGDNRQWEITVTPAGNADVRPDARTTTDCACRHAICDSEGRKSNGDLTLTVKGPQPPHFTSGPAFVFTEGSTTIATLAATDYDTEAAAIAWLITGGDDSAHFPITTDGALSIQEAKDYEAQNDANVDHAYQLTVQVSDGGRTDSTDLTVILVNVDEAPTAKAGVDQMAVVQ